MKTGGIATPAALQYAFTSAKLGTAWKTTEAPRPLGASVSRTWGWVIFQDVYTAGQVPSFERKAQ